MEYLEISISLEAAEGDRAAGQLIGAGFSGLVLGEEGPEQIPGEGVTLRVYLPSSTGGKSLADVVAALGEIPHRIATKTLDDEDWAHSWKRFWHVQHVGERMVVRPSWEDYLPEPGERVIVLDPKQAFGTGTHATTRLCLTEIEKLLQPHDRVFDIGTGSGILAIAAILLGADRAIGVDSDPVAVASALENAARNGVADRCEFACGSAADLEGQADLVVSNILAETLCDLAGDLAARVRRDLVLSGIILRKAELTRAAFEAHGLAFVSLACEGEWVVQRFVRP
ncbi:MAG: 50S ribosomal protein L11 methyltransferase [Cyanobacteria bacterium REEB65]|nr:50S ribosomal protein L11 methyltransferase [Cyanobacteria bacterium REEB65]